MNRIREFRIKNGYKQIELAKKLNISQASLSGYETGKYEPDIETLKAMALLFDTTIDYLFGRNVAPVAMPKKGVRIPVLGSVPAGVPIEAIEEILDYEEIPVEWTAGGKEYFGLIVKGDSMYPEYLNGDVLIIRKQPDCDSGDDCVVYVNGDYEATFKRVEKLSNGAIRIKPINPAYPPKTYSRTEVANLPIQIAGVVVELRRKRK